VGAVAAAGLLPAAALALVLVAALRRVPGLGRGPGLRAQIDGPRALYGVGWAVALLLSCGAVCALMLRLQVHPRMNPPLRALNLALLGPPLVAGAALLGHG